MLFRIGPETSVETRQNILDYPRKMSSMHRHQVQDQNHEHWIYGRFQLSSYHSSSTSNDDVIWHFIHFMSTNNNIKQLTDEGEVVTDGENNSPLSLSPSMAASGNCAVISSAIIVIFDGTAVDIFFKN